MVKTQNNRKTKRISPTLTALIGALVIMIGGFFLSYNYVQKMKIATFDTMAEQLNKAEKITKTEEKKENNEETQEKEETEPQINNETEMYLGYLSIPKINLKKGFFSIDSVQNDVEKNILIVRGSSYPDVDKGNFIIAAHSGTGWKAFFNDLYKLNQSDEIIVEYNGKNYHYAITKIYKQEKTGTVAIYRNYDKTTLTLITCTNNDSRTQTIYIAELTNIE